MNLIEILADQLFERRRGANERQQEESQNGQRAQAEPATARNRYELMLDEVVNGAPLAKDVSKLNLGPEALIGQVNGNDVDWETKLRFNLLDPNVQKGRTRQELAVRHENYLKNTTGDENLVIPGERPFGKNKHVRRVQLPQAVPTAKMLRLVAHDPRALEIEYPVLQEVLSVNNYLQKMTTLLQIDEAESQLEMRNYDLENVTLDRVNGFLALAVPGLADGRPSLMPGDTVLLKRHDSSNIYQGFIHHVNKDDVHLKFHPQFHEKYQGEQYDATFKESRTQIRRCHWAIQQSKNLSPSTLFPLNAIQFQSPKLNVTLETIRWINPRLNARQKAAVCNIIRGESRPSPYVIFGPPGTGKTMTIVEGILQVFKNFPKSRILACSGSNACADLIAYKLIESGLVDKNSMIRIIAHNRIDRVPKDLEPFSRVADDEVKAWLYHRIIVSTCSNVGKIIDYSPQRGHFSHTFIDEAAQATEPESLLSIVLSAANDGQTILAGDPFQLGPVILSKVAKSNGLAVPLMARLCDMKPYLRNAEQFSKSGHYDQRCITKLIESHRCCSELIYNNSKLFYHSELECKVPKDDQLLQKMNLAFPIIFDAVQGQDIQEQDNPSWCNLAEVLTCTKYLLQLYQLGVRPEEVGIITPYRKQAEKIRRFVESLGREICKVATIEEFQGGERRVIILSMVRSSPRHISHDLKFNLGFIFNDKRFNVSTSRAKSLLIVVGDPNVLLRDECWKLFIGYCKMNHATTGVEFKIPEELPQLPEDLLASSDDDDGDSMFDDVQE